MGSNNQSNYIHNIVKTFAESHGSNNCLSFILAHSPSPNIYDTEHPKSSLISCRTGRPTELSSCLSSLKSASQTMLDMNRQSGDMSKLKILCVFSVIRKPVIKVSKTSRSSVQSLLSFKHDTNFCFISYFKTILKLSECYI